MELKKSCLYCNDLLQIYGPATSERSGCFLKKAFQQLVLECIKPRVHHGMLAFRKGKGAEKGTSLSKRLEELAYKEKLRYSIWDPLIIKKVIIVQGIERKKN